MDHAYLISQGIRPIKFASAKHTDDSKPVPLFSVLPFFTRIYGKKMNASRMLEKYLQSYWHLPEGTPSISTQDQKPKPNTLAEEKLRFVQEHFTHDAPYFDLNTSEYLLTLPELYTLFFRIDERDQLPQLHQIRNYLCNRTSHESSMHKLMSPLEHPILLLLTTDAHAERIAISLDTLSTNFKQHIQSINFVGPCVHVTWKQPFASSKQPASSQPTTDYDLISKFLKECLDPFTWKRYVHSISFLTHSGSASVAPLLKKLPHSERNLRVAAHPRWLQHEICSSLLVAEQDPSHYNHAENFTLDPQKFETVLYALMDESDKLMASVLGAHWWQLFHEVLGDRHTDSAKLPSKDENNIPIASRAYWKMHEILRRDPRLREEVLGKEGGQELVAADVGASPGGWSQVLAQCCSKVYAIDPGQLRKDLLEFYNGLIVHSRKKVEVFLEEWQKRSDGSKLAVDLVVCDMNTEPSEVASILLPMAASMRSGGLFVMTLKLQKRSNNKLGENKAREVEQVLGEHLEDFRVHWLFANTQNERMLVARRK